MLVAKWDKKRDLSLMLLVDYQSHMCKSPCHVTFQTVQQNKHEKSSFCFDPNLELSMGHNHVIDVFKCPALYQLHKIYSF